MMLKLHWLAAFGLLLPALAYIQPPQSAAQTQASEPQQPAQVLSRVAAGPPPPSTSQKMYEDVEIMRRIINRKLGLWPGLIALNTKNCTVCHDVSGSHVGQDPELVRRLSLDLFGTLPAVADFAGDDWLDVFLAHDTHGYETAHASLGVPTDVEGVYLKGQGAVYTLTLPPPRRSPRVATKETLSKSLTDWERALRSVRGDQPPPQKSEPVKEPSERGVFAELEKSGYLGLTEAILRVLAENGHHFSQLAPDEKITVAVTFREPNRTTNQNQTGIQANNPLQAWGNTPGAETPTWEGQNFQPGAGGLGGGGLGGGGFSGGGFSGGGSGFSGGSGLAGGGDTSQAIGGGTGGGGIIGGAGGSGAPQTPASVRDFELLGDRLLKQGKTHEAIKAFQRALNLNPPTKRSAALYRKIAQADLAMENDAAAKKALAMAEELLKEAADPTPKSSSGGDGKSTTPSSLPPKLIISASKRLLDQVGMDKGRIPYPEFRRQATIEYFGFSPKSTN